MSNKRSVECPTHGKRASAVVCGHHVGKSDRPVGFVENSDDPDDLQAWCDACEELFVREGTLTPRFRAFNDFAVVCVRCYARHKKLHTS